MYMEHMQHACTLGNQASSIMDVIDWLVFDLQYNTATLWDCDIH